LYTGWLPAPSGGCNIIKVDYACEYAYAVENRLSQRIIVLHQDYHSGPMVSDTIQSHKSRVLLSESGMCEKNYVPAFRPLPFDSIEVYHDDTVKINRNCTAGLLYTSSARDLSIWNKSKFNNFHSSSAGNHMLICIFVYVYLTGHHGTGALFNGSRNLTRV